MSVGFVFISTCTFADELHMMENPAVIKATETVPICTKGRHLWTFSVVCFCLFVCLFVCFFGKSFLLAEALSLLVRKLNLIT